jgi:hypothetical protein
MKAFISGNGVGAQVSPGWRDKAPRSPVNSLTNTGHLAVSFWMGLAARPNKIVTFLIR